MRSFAALAILGALAGPAWAQADEEDRFFIDKADEDDAKTLWQGSLTSSTFYFRESGALGTPLGAGLAAPENGSKFARLFTDLRAQIDARHVKGGRWDVRLDTRMRYVKNPFATDQVNTEENRIQSGTFGENEYEVRELYAVRGGRRTDLFFGRQIIADLGAIKIDGLRLDYAKNARWTYLGFAGLYPMRGSRSIATDYPQSPIDPAAPMAARKRVTPVTGGIGGAYRTQKTYGALGAVLIVPLSRDVGGGGNGTFEQPRVYVVANGYSRRSATLDLWHYLIVDLYGSAGQALTNASGGVQWKPRPRLRVHLSANQIDVEALNVQVRDQLADEAPLDGTVINNLKVQRIGSLSGRAAVTGGFGKLSRFEISAALSGRRRPKVVLEAGNNDQELPAAQSLELMLQVVDRRSWKGMRVDGSYIRSVGVGAASYARSRSQIFRVAATRELKEGKAELGGDVTFVSTADDNAGSACLANVMTQTCWGSANTVSLVASGQAYYRFKPDWFLTSAAGLGTQKITVTSVANPGTGIPQPTTIYGHLFLRLGYRF